MCDDKKDYHGEYIEHQMDITSDEQEKIRQELEEQQKKRDEENE